MYAAARRKRSLTLWGCWAMRALRVGISAGVTGAGRGPPAQATIPPHIPKSRCRRPAKSRTPRERGDKMPQAETPQGTAYLTRSDRAGYDARHRGARATEGWSNNKEGDAQASRRPPRGGGTEARPVLPTHSRLCSIWRILDRKSTRLNSSHSQ